ncbi:cytochrome P450, partial [Salmonella sp. s57402]|uniref:cytochrome P450 n=1 Tax=Salmonella sp. s57402 TaxID=3159695 RepID=UPI00397F3254
KNVDGNENSEDGKASGLRYLNFVIKESLRLHPPAPLLIPRHCREACDINGYHIPKKTRVIINAWGIGRDPEVWEDAEKFIPERFEKNMFEFNGANFEYIPFGSGRRICPGIPFGLATIEMALTQLLYHFNWKLPNDAKGETINMEETS